MIGCKKDSLKNPGDTSPHLRDRSIQAAVYSRARSLTVSRPTSSETVEHAHSPFLQLCNRHMTARVVLPRQTASRPTSGCQVPTVYRHQPAWARTHVARGRRERSRHVSGGGRARTPGAIPLAKTNPLLAYKRAPATAALAHAHRAARFSPHSSISAVRPRELLTSTPSKSRSLRF